MHIVIANQWFPPDGGWGGVAMYNNVIAHAYSALGHQVTVIARRNEATTPAFTKTDGIRIHRLLTRDHYYWRRMPVAGYYSRPVQQLCYSWRVSRAIKRVHKTRPIDVIEFAEINAEGFFFALASQIPFVVRCHTPTFVLHDLIGSNELPFDTRIVSACEKDMIRRAHTLTTPSKDMAQRIAEATGIAREKIAVIPNPLPSYGSNGDANGHKPIRSEQHELTVLYVGRLERAKGILVLAEAIPQIIKRVPQTRFLIAGYDRSTPRGTSQRAELEQQLATAGVRANVEFLGAVEQSSLRTLYERADLCVAPALQYESFSYTCAQAMAAGKPVIGTRVGGVPETVSDGVSGLIVEPGDAGELTAAVVRLLKDEARRAEMGRAGHEKVLREYQPMKIAKQNLEIYAHAKQVFEHRAG